MPKRRGSSLCMVSAGFDRGSAFWAEERLVLGPGAQDGVDDEGKSPSRNFACGLDRSVNRTSSGLGLDFGGHDLSPVIDWYGRGLAAERQPAEGAQGDEESGGSPCGDDEQIQAGEAQPGGV